MGKKVKDVLFTILIIVVADIIVCYSVVWFWHLVSNDSTPIVSIIGCNIVGAISGSAFMRYWIDEVED